MYRPVVYINQDNSDNAACMKLSSHIRVDRSLFGVFYEPS